MLRVLFQFEAGPSMASKLESLKDQGLCVDAVPVHDKERFAECLQSADVLWHVLHPVTEGVIRSAPSLRLIQKIGVGLNTIDLNTARDCNIAV